ncbi:MAG: hypothetical protein A2Z50_00965 [Nitrospirae bacterium RBG_19FT_COMBO_42_15]|nr:MAG: hypothetical protein A2Z50_00965 [Nitrospirae bacterium RBG_19FT_COMBO_42_15]
MIKKILKKAEAAVKANILFNIEAYLEERQEKNGRHPIHDNRYHLQEAIGWLKRAQDATPDGGVSRGYSIAWNPYFQSKGWQPSYPETTGYIIPTFFECAKYLNDSDLFNRAVRMAEWEIAIQMKSGAVRGGVISKDEPIPSVFCTGQVIFGWVHTYKETGNDNFLIAAKKAGDFLLTVQDANGQLVEDGKYNFADREATAYHTRVAWSLILLGQAAKEKRYIHAGIKNIEYNLKFQEKNGWFKNNCLYDATQPLLHTICYVTEGLLGAGLLLKDERFIKAARSTADSLLLLNSKGEYLPGRFNKDWMGTVNWSCLTGDAQLSVIFLRLYGVTKDVKYLDGARRLIEFIKTTQNCSTANLGIRGGIKGSYPVSGTYGKYQILNWATKFYADALLLDELICANKGYVVYG